MVFTYASFLTMSSGVLYIVTIPVDVEGIELGLETVDCFNN